MQVECIGRRAVLAVVADGAGSAARGGEGAAIAVAAAGRVLRRLRSAQLNAEAASAVLDAVEAAIADAFAGQAGSSPRDYAATLLAVLLRRRDDGVHWLTLHIGDGMIAADLGNGVQVLSEPENGEFGNSTFFVTDRNAAEHLRVSNGIAPSAAFALMTDGAAETLYHRRSRQAAPAVGTLLAWCRDESPRRFNVALAENLRTVIALRTRDDATMAVVAA